ncbi:hypothetical protein [Aequorivita capsosiphonis]|uniref:hypothetical protein n=1 Tax=Aequorivita capsosiphonis TaxID=487317 RepID=UPI0003F812F3|nr:hypothetical protein [Aequorivita capsosiphonis]
MNNYIFENQFKQEIHREAAKIGFKISASKSFTDTLLDFLTVRMKLIDKRPRVAIMSPPLLNDFFTHPKRKEIESIFNIAKNGGDLNRFQSKKLLESRFHDHLLNEWNIHHFHLSLKKVGKSKLESRGNELLFAYIDDEQILFLGLAKHTPGIFADTKWIEILQDYFPKVLKPFEMKNWKDIYPKVNAKERQMLWNKGYTIGMTKVREKVYFSPGMGRMTSGHGNDVVTLQGNIIRWMHKIDLQIVESLNEICNYLKIPKDKIKFIIRFGEENLELCELSSRMKILTYDEEIIPKTEIMNKITE